MADRPKNTIVGHIKNGFLARMMHFSAPTIAVWLALANRADESGYCHPSIDALQEDTGLARHTVTRALRVLEEAKEIAIEHGKGVGSKYIILTGSASEPVQQVNQFTARTTPVQQVNRTSSLNEPQPVHGAHSNQTREPNARTKHKNQTKARGTAAVAKIPKELDSDSFREAWGRWTAYRKELRRPLTPSTTKAQLRKLATWGRDRAVAAIDGSIESGWVGIFEASKNGNGKPASNYADGPGQRYDPNHKSTVPIVGGF